MPSWHPRRSAVDNGLFGPSGSGKTRVARDRWTWSVMGSRSTSIVAGVKVERTASARVARGGWISSRKTRVSHFSAWPTRGYAATPGMRPARARTPSASPKLAAAEPRNSRAANSGGARRAAVQRVRICWLPIEPLSLDASHRNRLRHGTARAAAERRSAGGSCDSRPWEATRCADGWR